MLTTPDGSSYDGNWLNGMFHGNGIYYYGNGARYEGEFYEHLR